MDDHFPSLVLGYHGCDRSVAEKVFAGETDLTASKNSYDWLGHGTYFWENNPARALEFAQFLHDHPRRGRTLVREPYVVGAVIDLGCCLNLLDSAGLRLVRDAYKQLETVHTAANVPLPQNKPLTGSSDLLLRNLDCAVIELMHQIRAEEKLPDFDSVRGVFVEGAPLYPNAGFHEKNHIQLCLRSSDCIRGYFRVRKYD